MTSITAPPTELPFELGKPQSFQGLGLIPLFSRDEPALEYIGLDEAAAAGLVVTEIDQSGSVGTLAVSNPLKDNVLLYEGEELIGAKQNRVLERTILVHAQSKTPVPVNCVERGRWSYRSEQFAPAPRAAHPQMRRMSREAGQAGGLGRDLRQVRASRRRVSDRRRRGCLLQAQLVARRVPRGAAASGGPVRGDRRRWRPRRLPRLRLALRGLRRALREAPPRLRPRRRRAAGRRARARGLRAAAGQADRPREAWAGKPARPRRRPRRHRTRPRRLRARPRRRGRRPQRLPDRSGVRSSAVAVDS